MRRTTLWHASAAAISLAAALFVACSSATDADPDPSAGQPSAPAAAAPSGEHPAPGGFLPDERQAAGIRAALVSVEYHALHPTPTLPRELTPIPLDEAVRSLLADAAQSSFGESRRRRSIVTLVAGGLDLSATPPIRNRDQIDLLLGDQAAAFDRFLVTALAQRFSVSGLAEDERLANTGLQKDIQQFLDTAGPAIAGCRVEPPVSINTAALPPELSCDGTSFPERTTWQRTEVGVSRSDGFAALAAALDPQNWDEHGIDIATGAACNPFFVSAFASDPNGVPLDCAPNTGDDWAGSLYEQFLWSASVEEFSLATVLSITANLELSPAPARYRFDYCLSKSVDGVYRQDQMQTTIQWSGDVDVDEGFLTAEATGSGDAHLVADKKLHFTGWKDDAGVDDHSDAMNASAGFHLTAMGKALAEAACCVAPPAPACQTPPSPPPVP